MKEDIVKRWCNPQKTAGERPALYPPVVSLKSPQCVDFLQTLVKNSRRLLVCYRYMKKELNLRNNRLFNRRWHRLRKVIECNRKNIRKKDTPYGFLTTPYAKVTRPLSQKVFQHAAILLKKPFHSIPAIYLKTITWIFYLTFFYRR